MLEDTAAAAQKQVKPTMYDLTFQIDGESYMEKPMTGADKFINIMLILWLLLFGL